MRSVALLSALAAYASATRVSTEELQNKLRLAPNTVSRVKILDQDDDFVFNFLNPPGGTGETIGKGGHTVGATGANFPALIGTGMAMTVGFLGPCGFNTPHTHPRATEFNIVVAGSALRTGIIHENGGRFIHNDVPLGSAAIFQQGVIHFEQNLGCHPAVFVAGFNNEDPGVDQIGNRFFELDPAAVSATLGGLEVQTFKEIQVPANVALGADECLKRCKIDRATFVWNGTAPYGLGDGTAGQWKEWDDWKQWNEKDPKSGEEWWKEKDPKEWDDDYKKPDPKTPAPKPVDPKKQGPGGGDPKTSPPANTDPKKASAQQGGGEPKSGAKVAPGTGGGNALLSETSVNSSNPSDIPFGENPLRTTVIALASVAAALLLALIAALIRIFTAPKRVVYDSLNYGAKDGPKELLLGEKSYPRSHSRSTSKVDAYDPPHDRD
jgi:hypothetical protein